MNKVFFVTAIAVGAMGLQGCGGSSTTPVTIPTTPSYNNLNATSGSSTIGGTMLTSSNQGVYQETVSGTLTHSTGGVQVDASEYSLVDVNGPDSTGVYVSLDGNTAAALVDEGYDYATTAVVTNPSLGLTSVGVIGIVTSASDMPTAGTARYTGTSVMTYADPSQTLSLEGNVNATADFGAATPNVSVSIIDITATESGTTSSVASPINAVSVIQAPITGNSFSTDRVTLLSGGSIVTPFGDNTDSTLNGTMFGYDQTANAPDEIGGVLAVGGDDGALIGIFLAD